MKLRTFFLKLLRTRLFIRVGSFFVLMTLIAHTTDEDRQITISSFFRNTEERIEEECRKNLKDTSDDQSVQDSCTNFKLQYMDALDVSGTRTGIGLGFLSTTGSLHNHPVDTTGHSYFFVEGFLLNDYKGFFFRGNQCFVSINEKETATNWRYVVNRKGQTLLMIQLTGGFWRIAVSVFQILLLVLSICFFVWVIAYPFWVINEIAEGNPFHPANANRLRWAGLALLALVVVPVLAGLLMQRSVNQSYPGLFEYSWLDQLFRKKFLLASGIICLLLSSAFRKGARMQQEQELTV